MKVSKAMMIMTLKEKGDFVKWMEYREHMEKEKLNSINPD